MKPELFRVALIGPESTGKTTLCKELAEYYNTCWVPEYARELISKLNRPYTKEDIIFCAEQQLKSEKQIALKANKILFSDSEFIILKVWLLDVFGECPEWIEKNIAENKYDLYLLTSPDIPFIDDPVRENPNRRQFFFEWYKSELDKRKFRYEIIEGLKESRIKNAIQSVKKCICKDFI